MTMRSTFLIPAGPVQIAQQQVPSIIISGVGEWGRGGGGALPPPLFGHVCTLNEEKISSCSMSATVPSQYYL